MSSITYFILEVVAVTALVLLTVVVTVSYPKNRNAWLFGLFALSNACYLLVRMSFKKDGFDLDLGLFAHPIQILMNSGSGLLMLFCFSMFQDLRRIPVWLIALFGLQLVLSLVRVYVVPMDMIELDRAQPGVFKSFVLLTMPFLLQGTMGMLAMFYVLNGWQGDLVNSRRLLRGACLAFFGVYGIGVMSAEIAIPTAEPEMRLILNNGITLLAAVWACGMLIVATRVDSRILESAMTRIVSGEARTSRDKSKLTSEADYARFLEVFEVKKAYLQHGLSLGGLAGAMGIPQYRLRQLIHSRLGYRNFNALLHAYRINEACEELSDPAKKAVPVLTIALSLGYQSIAPFNQAFREIVGQTPTGYRKSRLSVAP